MSSPFSTFEEFSQAEGPIYTFANSPGIITFLLIVCLLITIYFFYASYGMKQESHKVDPKAIGLFLVAGLASAIGLLSQPSSSKDEAVQARAGRSETLRSEVQSRRWQPFALLGLTGLGGAALKPFKSRSKQRGSSRYRSHASKRSR